jgi:hypothetical protein
MIGLCLLFFGQRILLVSFFASISEEFIYLQQADPV